jgi:hypothetical protein
MVRLDSFYTCSSRQPKCSKTIGGVERWMRLYMYHSDKANRAARSQLPGYSVRAGQSRDPSQNPSGLRQSILLDY